MLRPFALTRNLSMALLWTLAAGEAQAATVMVTRTADDSSNGSLRWAVANHTSGDTIAFDSSLAGQTITLSSTANSVYGLSCLVISDDVTIDGSAASGLVIDVVGFQRPFLVSAGGTLTLKNLTLSNGKAKGGNGGAGIRATGGGALGAGGAIFVDGGTLNITGCTLSGHAAVGGNAGGYGGGSSNGGTGGGGMGGNGYIANTMGFGGAGGGINGGAAGSYASNGGNGGVGGGGGGSYGGGDTCGNAGAGGFGGGGGAVGGVFYSKVSLGGDGGFGGGAGAAGNADVSGGATAGTPGFGGGAADSGSGFSLFGGGGAGMGGAIFINGGTVTLTNSTLTGNSATGGTGYTNGSGLGGAIFNRNGSLTLLNCTLSGNTVANNGRHVYNLGDGATATATINNSILSQSDGTLYDFFGNAINSGTITTSGVGNLMRDYMGFSGTATKLTDPNLAALANNGGPTKTMMPNAGSPALGAGNAAAAASLTVDQRGFARFTGGSIDIGAVESASTVISLSAFTAQAASGGLQITWTTGSEIDTAGFNIWRSAASDGTYAKQTSTLIPATGISPAGASYAWLDANVSDGQTWFYKLEEIDAAGASALYGPVSATLSPSSILTFTATPPSIFTGGVSQLAWSLNGSPSLTLNGGAITGTSLWVTPDTTTSYTLSDGSISKLLTVNVKAFALTDMAGLSKAWGTSSTDAAYDPCYDLNGDGLVDDTDVTLCLKD